jgi:hypothetical protein
MPVLSSVNIRECAEPPEEFLMNTAENNTTESFVNRGHLVVFEFYK